MKSYLNGILYSFPVQLFLLHIKRNHFLVLFWVILICFVTGALGSRYGITLLFLDPEYYGNVGFFSFLLLGIAFGGFYVVWNVSSYILHAQYFSFLATLKRPFGIYCLNNSIFPLLFFLIFMYYSIAFQAAEGLLDFGNISYRLGGFIAGIVFVILLSMIYFFRTNKDIFQMLGGDEKKSDGEQLNPDEPTLEQTGIHMDIPVEYYINHSFRVKITRSADHYPISLIRSVYKQHHANALFIELSGLVLIVLFSLLIDYPFFRIPAGASILLICTILVMLFGAFTFWLGQWKIFFFIVLVIAVNLLMRSNLLQYNNKAYGLKYETKAPYNYAALHAYSDESNVQADRSATINILNTWKHKFDSIAPVKPKIIFINVSGGGLRASMFVMKVLQEADSITQHKLMQHCPLITGASGGMLAAAYYRELYLRAMKGEDIEPADVQYVDNISQDLLNAVGFTLVVNDMFYPWQRFTHNETTFRKDRGYMFEKIFNENTDFVLSKPLSDYAEDERKMNIPMMLFYPSILNDERKLFIGTQNFSYLGVASERLHHYSKPEIDGVDFHYLCAGNDPDSILFTTVLRMNCTFPYILPNVHLPTEPGIEVMDAGVRDNYGIQVSARFIEEFSDWIKTNTSGVIVLNIRGIEQQMKIRENVTQGVMEKFFSPIGTLYYNWVEIQDYQNENILNTLDKILEGNLEVITFEYLPDENSKRASLSLHLTAREKRDILAACNSAANTEAYRKLEQLLK